VLTLNRRRFLALGAAALVPAAAQPSRQGNSRLRARPGTPTATIAAGEHPLGLASDRDGLLRIPAKYRPGTPAPLAVLLHGAGGRARRIVSLLGVADSLGVIVLAPESRGGSTWDAIRGDFREDVAFINKALEKTFDTVATDPARLTIAGFSDGASYALSLGLINGGLFKRIAAFSPGFIVDGTPGGKPRVFVSHGTGDTILPIEQCSRAIVARLKARSYDVTFREFPGGHEIPAAVQAEGLGWVVART